MSISIYHVDILVVTYNKLKIIIVFLLVDDTSTPSFIQILGNRRKAQTRFNHGILVVERNPYWHSHQDDCGYYTLAYIISKIKNRYFD